MLLAGCGTAADTSSNRAVTDEARTNETDSEISIVTTGPNLDIETTIAESEPASTTTSRSQAATETIPARPPPTTTTTTAGESTDEVDDSPISVDAQDEDDSAAFPQVTFPEATVRDAEAEAADLERRRSVIGLFQRLLVEAEHRGGYDRNAIFGGWLYANGQSTRERVLADERHSDGSWNSAYDNTTVTSAGDLDIDHLVPLAEAWESGGYSWSVDTWTRFANDLGDARSLIAVSSGTNRSKGSRDPHDWWPPQVSYRCQYAADWIAVKIRWSLSADAAEQRSLDTQLSSCTGSEFEFTQPAPGSVTIEDSPSSEIDSPETSEESDAADAELSDAEAAAADDGCHPAYEPCLANLPGDALNCGDLTAEQKPVYVKVIGEDPYRLDRDGNGVGCQS